LLLLLLQAISLLRSGCFLHVMSPWGPLFCFSLQRTSW
jgi:hypothetical protein